MTNPMSYVQSPDGSAGFSFRSRACFLDADGAETELELTVPSSPDGWLDDPVPGAGRVRVAEAREERNGVAATVRMAWLAEGRYVVRVILRNTRTDVVRVRRLTPVAVAPGTLRLRDRPVAEWTYFRQPRKKNDMPAAIRLGDLRPGVMDAVRGTPETGGIPAGGLAGGAPTRFVSSEVTVLGAGDDALLLGVLPAHRQLVTCELQVSDDRSRLEVLDLHCECDGQLLAPGACMESQWVIIDLSHSPLDALTAYAGLLSAHYSNPNADRAAAPPTVWCSWYYYGDGFTQAEAEENVAWLSAHPLPVDVIQIDECWDLRWGDWEPNADWPDLRTFAARIRDAGYEPGIWSCPFLAEPRAHVRHHRPHWLLRDTSGEPVRFSMNNMQNCVLDPTHPEVLTFLENTFRRFTRDWGFTYHKLDFTRAVAEPNAVFHDPSRNRAEAYRMGLEAVRRGMGPGAYMNVCGGLYGPALGLANAQRTGSDVKSVWPAAPIGQEEEEGYGPFTIKQNTLRYWLNAVAHNDPDALMVRRRPEPYREERLSLGLMTNEEALTSALNQYLGGGLVCFTERLPEIETDRLLLLRHCAPSIGVAALPLDAVDGVRFPSVFFTAVTPRAPGLGGWATVAFVNWTNEPRTFRLATDAALVRRLRTAFGDGWGETDDVLVTSFRRGTTRRLPRGQDLSSGPVAAHGCDVLKIQPFRPRRLQLLHTDGHFSMGAAEVAGWEPTEDGVDMILDWRWPCPLTLSVGRCEDDGHVRTRALTVPAGAGRLSESVRL